MHLEEVTVTLLRVNLELVTARVCVWLLLLGNGS
jgi:hypothetical protein